jgi:cytochrome c-type biogenesis protein CcmH
MIKRWTTILLLIPIVASVSAVPKSDSHDAQKLYQTMIHEARCLVCQNQNIAGSESRFSQDMREQIARMIDEGSDKDDIERALVDRYGEKVLFKPAHDSRMWVLWYGPYGLVMVGLCAMWGRRRWKQ